MTTTWLRTDALTGLATLPDDYFGCVCTSPPYLARRSYGDNPLELGQGTRDEFVKDLVAIMGAVRRVLHPKGLAWLNIGDTSIGSGGAGGDHAKGGIHESKRKYRQVGKAFGTLAPMQWGMVPQHVAVALQDDGWLIRSWLTWDKGKPRPEDYRHARRPGQQCEVILVLAKHRDHFYDHTALPKGDLGDVWHFGPSTRPNAGPAPFPIELPRRAIGCSWPGPVLDPMAGSGTTALAADQYERDCTLIDLPTHR